VRLWSPAIDLQSASARAIWLRLAVLMLEVSFELDKFTLTMDGFAVPVTITIGSETREGATKFWVEVGETDDNGSRDGE